MDLSKKYFDSKVNERNIMEMVQLEPKWAAERIQRLEAELKQKEDFANVFHVDAPSCQTCRNRLSNFDMCSGCMRSNKELIDNYEHSEEIIK